MCSCVVRFQLELLAGLLAEVRRWPGNGVGCPDGHKKTGNERKELNILKTGTTQIGSLLTNDTRSVSPLFLLCV